MGSTTTERHVRISTARFRSSGVLLLDDNNGTSHRRARQGKVVASEKCTPDAQDGGWWDRETQHSVSAVVRRLRNDGQVTDRILTHRWVHFSSRISLLCLSYVATLYEAI